MVGFFSWYCVLPVDAANHRHHTLDLHQKMSTPPAYLRLVLIRPCVHFKEFKGKSLEVRDTDSVAISKPLCILTDTFLSASSTLSGFYLTGYTVLAGNNACCLNFTSKFSEETDSKLLKFCSINLRNNFLNHLTHELRIKKRSSRARHRLESREAFGRRGRFFQR
ncbi:uncharacterized protein LOC112873927 isoform X2 [Panicum hallii]|uniref:uncharacterized protein LOC112873927 isoform X2 n=1 Tax=Panicum hallii TaxID=206008 RepID=UPI000DF4D643|nr:uncharacterized protein LOC112873927 isoform X2 [Panicum hallii]